MLFWLVIEGVLWLFVVCWKGLSNVEFCCWEIWRGVFFYFWWCNIWKVDFVRVLYCWNGNCLVMCSEFLCGRYWMLMIVFKFVLEFIFCEYLFESDVWVILCILWFVWFDYVWELLLRLVYNRCCWWFWCVLFELML